MLAAQQQSSLHALYEQRLFTWEPKFKYKVQNIKIQSPWARKKK